MHHLFRSPRLRRYQLRDGGGGGDVGELADHAHLPVLQLDLEPVGCHQFLVDKGIDHVLQQARDLQHVHELGRVADSGPDAELEGGGVAEKETEASFVVRAQMACGCESSC